MSPTLSHIQPHRTYTSPNTPMYIHHPHPHHHHDYHHHHSSTMIPAPPLLSHSSYPCSSSTSSSSYPQTPVHKTTSHSHSQSRPKAIKKLSASTSGKHRSVQVSLEVKVEKAKGFHAFFVPLARNLPPAPPSSPVLAGRQISQEVLGLREEDYFGGWDKQKKKGRREEWVEDVSGEESMEVDSE